MAALRRWPLTLLRREGAPAATLGPAANRQLNTREIRDRRITLQSTPLQLNVDLIGVCNVNPPCVFCSGKNVGHNYRPLPAASLDQHERFLARCERINDDSFGEPLMHAEFLQVVQRFTGNGQYFTFVTNGLLLAGTIARTLVDIGPRFGVHVSFNAASPETYGRLTGKSFAVLRANVAGFVAQYRARHAGAPPDVVLTFIVMRLNREEVGPFVRLAAELGAPSVLLASLHDRPSRPLGHFGYDFVYRDEVLPLDELQRAGREAQDAAADHGIDVRLQWDARADSALRTFAEPGVDIPCQIPWRFLHVQQHSERVYACPYHTWPIGDLTRQPLAAIWNGPEASELRTSLAAGRIPQFCWNHSAACPLVLEARAHRVGEPLSTRIVMGENDHQHLDEGWHALEQCGEPVRWTADRASFRIAASGARRLVIRCLSFKPELTCAPARGYVRSGTRLLGRFALERLGWHDLEFPLPPAAVSESATGELAVEIVVETAWTPSEVLETSVMEAVVGVPRVIAGSRDTRRLGIVVQQMRSE